MLAAGACALCVLAAASPSIAQAPDVDAATAEDVDSLSFLDAGFSFAPADRNTPFTPEAAALVGEIDAYLNGVDTVEAQFVQEVVDVGLRQTILSARGVMYLDRPGRFRFDYEPPHVDPARIVSNGAVVQLSYPELGQTDDIALRATPLHLFVKSDVNLRRDARVTWVAGDEAEAAITVRDPGGEVEGALTLMFDRGVENGENTLELKAWEVLDAAGLLTRTSLYDVARDQNLPARLFRVAQPERPRGFR